MFDFATTIGSLTFTTTTNTASATFQSGEPYCTGSIDKTVWYRYLAPTNTTLRADTIGSTFDTVITVYEGTSLDQLSEVACVDREGSTVGEQAVFQVVAGFTYYFQVGGSDGASGDLSFRVRGPNPPPGPPHDAFGSPEPVLDPLPFSHSVDTSTASRQSGEPDASCADIGRTVWYRYTPSRSTTLEASTPGSDFDTASRSTAERRSPT